MTSGWHACLPDRPADTLLKQITLALYSAHNYMCSLVGFQPVQWGPLPQGPNKLLFSISLTSQDWRRARHGAHWFSVYFTQMWKVFKMHFCLQSTRGSYTYDLIAIKSPLSQFTVPEPQETNTWPTLRKARQGDLRCEMHLCCIARPCLKLRGGIWKGHYVKIRRIQLNSGL